MKLGCSLLVAFLKSRLRLCVQALSDLKHVFSLVAVIHRICFVGELQSELALVIEIFVSALLGK